MCQLQGFRNGTTLSDLSDRSNYHVIIKENPQELLAALIFVLVNDSHTFLWFNMVYYNFYIEFNEYGIINFVGVMLNVIYQPMIVKKVLILYGQLKTDFR